MYAQASRRLLRPDAGAERTFQNSKQCFRTAKRHSRRKASCVSLLYHSPGGVRPDPSGLESIASVRRPLAGALQGGLASESVVACQASLMRSLMAC